MIFCEIVRCFKKYFMLTLLFFFNLIKCFNLLKNSGFATCLSGLFYFGFFRVEKASLLFYYDECFLVSNS